MKSQHLGMGQVSAREELDAKSWLVQGSCAILLVLIVQLRHTEPTYLNSLLRSDAL
jgi:hypothetical protein